MKILVLVFIEMMPAIETESFRGDRTSYSAWPRGSRKTC